MATSLVVGLRVFARAWSQVAQCLYVRGICDLQSMHAGQSGGCIHRHGTSVTRAPVVYIETLAHRDSPFSVLYISLFRHRFFSSKVHYTSRVAPLLLPSLHRPHLERIVLRWCLLMEVFANSWQLHQNVLSHSRNVIEEEQEEE